MGKKTFIGMLLAITAMVMSIGMSSCSRLRNSMCYSEKQDSVKLELALERWHNPAFSDAQEFVKYTKDETEYISFVDLCAGLDNRTIEAVARQAITTSSRGAITWKDFLKEFKSHETIYRNFDKTLSPPVKLSEYQPEVEKIPDDTLSAEEHIIQELKSNLKQ